MWMCAWAGRPEPSAGTDDIGPETRKSDGGPCSEEVPGSNVRELTFEGEANPRGRLLQAAASANTQGQQEESGSGCCHGNSHAGSPQRSKSGQKKQNKKRIRKREGKKKKKNKKRNELLL